MAVPFEKPQKHENRTVNCPSFRENCSPLVTIVWQQMMGNQSKVLILIGVKKLQREKDKKTSSCKKCAKWQLKGCTAVVANKRGGE